MSKDQGVEDHETGRQVGKRTALKELGSRILGPKGTKAK